MNRRTRIKICGITREDDVDAAVAAGADAIGFMRYAKSTRFVTADRAAELAARLPPFVTPVLVWVNAHIADVEEGGAQALLLDAPVEGYGGGGKVFDWSLVVRDVPRPVVLSGGLHASNVIEGILAVRPWAVDVSSGVERDKGIKDADAIRRFCDAVRQADARLVAST